MIKVLQGCILKLSFHSVNSVLILYRTGTMQSAILLSFVASSSLPPCGLQSTHPPMPSYISPYIVYNVYVSIVPRRSKVGGTISPSAAAENEPQTSLSGPTNHCLGSRHYRVPGHPSGFRETQCCWLLASEFVYSV